MKKVNLFLVVTLITMFILNNNLIAQASAKSDDPVEKIMCCKGNSYYNIPDLTDEQKKKIDELKTAHLKEVHLIKAQLNEKKAHLHTLQLAEKPDNSAINKTIDEISMLKNQMMKKHESYRQAVRVLLTEKQKLAFDAKGGCSHDNKAKECCSKSKAKECCGSDKSKTKGCCSGDKSKTKSCSSGTSEHQPVKGKGCCHR